MTDRAERQRESIQVVRMSEPLYAQLAQYAEDNAMSVSEAMREIIESYADGKVPRPERKRRSRRVSIWIDPALWMAFKRRAIRDKARITDAIEAALEENL